MNLTEQITAAASAVTSAEFRHRAIYVNTLSLQELYRDKESQVLFELSNHPKPNPLDQSNMIGHAYQIAQTSCVTDLLSIKYALDLAEASPDFIEAKAILEPKIAELRRLEAMRDAEAAKLSEAERVLAEVRELATLKAAAQVESDPAVVKAAEAVKRLGVPMPPREKLAVELLADPD